MTVLFFLEIVRWNGYLQILLATRLPIPEEYTRKPDCHNVNHGVQFENSAASISKFLKELASKLRHQSRWYKNGFS